MSPTNSNEGRSEKTVDGIRVAFHKKNMRDIPAIGRKIMDKGYKFYIQPMITMRYTDREMLDLIDMINKELPDASTIGFTAPDGEEFAGWKINGQGDTFEAGTIVGISCDITLVAQWKAAT